MDEYYFTGSQIYKATNSMNYLDSKGFLYETWVRGYWWSDYLAFEETGYVIDAGQGSFTMLLQNGEVVEIGGRMSYKEQIGASEIRLIIKTKSTVNYRMYSNAYEGLEGFISGVDDAASFLEKFQIDDIAITGSISFDQDVEASMVLDETINDELRKGMYFVKSIDVTSQENGFKIEFEQASLSEMEMLDDILMEHGIDIGEIFSSDLNVFIRTATEIGELDKYWIKEYIAENLSALIDPDENSIHIRL
ncbi:MAG: hypothetical protein JW825_04700 [Candidatus Methanofastidiosa archaeon]|nr:hypothetical protein [Candidatus Methanofastidiosa archaeon]